MKPNNCPGTPVPLAGILACFALLAAPLPASVLFSEDFSGGNADLNGSTPDSTTGGAAWVASANFNQDGSIDQGTGSATLAFTPANGFVYNLDASISGVSGDGDWFALGFANGQSALSTTNDRFISGNVVGTAWILMKGDASGSANSSFLGLGTPGTGNHGLTSQAAWAALTNENPGGDIDLRIVLDTSGGTGTWTATWFAKRPADVTYTEVRPATAMLTESCNAVGLAISNEGVFGTIQSFSLSDDGVSPSDTTPPAVLSQTPAAAATGVSVDTSLVLTFNETITPGTGNITIRRSGGNTVVESFAAGSSTLLNFSGPTLTIDPSDHFDPATGYDILIDATAIKDTAGNRFAGIAEPAPWHFTTIPATSDAPGPYTADEFTLHLWHFDESDPGPVAPAPGLTGSFALVPASGATLGAPSFPGFGSAGDTSAGADDGFEGSTIPVSAVTGPDGAFTFEALIRTSELNSIQQILTMENSGANGDRPFQFRIDSGNLRFINVSSNSQSVLTSIPTTGDHAFVPDEWFHVAVTYNGDAGILDNIRLYWTRVSAQWTEANQIHSDSMSSDLGGIATTFGAGQEFRSPSDNLEGRIDEVRISGIARRPDGFLFLSPDTDNDGLPDPWEILYFRENPGESESVTLARYDGADDPDNDTFDNSAEQAAGTDPNDSTHTPVDADRDGYEDVWELAVFGTILYGPSDDPDKDGFPTEDELSAGTDPANGASNPADTDADGLDDATEIALFGSLAQGPLDDFDADGIGNLAELDSGTDPSDGTDFPPVSLIPVTDGNAATDENGYAGSAINSIAFAQNNLITVGSQQFISYYRRHATDASHPDNNTLLVARRDVGGSTWEIFPTNFYSFNINDTHNVVSCAIDGDGLLHMSWGMHGNSLLYAKSDAPVTGTAPIRMVSLGTAGMTGQENSVTYPKFQTLPDGDVVFLFREGGSGNGDWFLHRYDIDTDTWAPIHANGSGVSQPFMLGRGDSPDNCFYPDRMTLGPDGMLHLAGVFRYNGDSLAGESGYQTNHRYVYLRSPDGGATWQRSDGSSIDLPVVEASWFQNLGASHVPEIVEDIPEGHSNMNEAGMTTDSAGRPIIANWWAVNALSGDHTRQYQIFFHDGTTWHRRTVSARDIDNPATKYSEGALSSSRMGRPVVLTDIDDRIIVIYNDNRFEGITVVFSLPLAQDPGRNRWTRMNITNENIGNWETTYDEERWKKDGVLQMLYQKLPGMGASYSGQNNSTPVSVVEWNARAYFNTPVRWTMDTVSNPGEATISAHTRIGYRYDLRTSTDLLFSDPLEVSLPGDGTWLNFGTWQTDEARRFWRFERIEEPLDNL